MKALAHPSVPPGSLLPTAAGGAGFSNRLYCGTGFAGGKLMTLSHYFL